MRVRQGAYTYEITDMYVAVYKGLRLLGFYDVITKELTSYTNNQKHKSAVQAMKGFA